MDFMALTKALPEIMKLAPKAEEFMAEWVKFMNHLNASLKFIEGTGQSTDNKIQYLISAVDGANEKLTLILSENNITPSLHADVLLMANADPRNRPDLEAN